MIKITKIIHYLIFPLIIIIIISSGCSISKPIRIGFITDLSSRNSQLGIQARNGLQMAINEINEQGGIKGRKLELFIEDNKGDVDECYEASLRLAEKEVSIIIGPLASSMADSVIMATDEKKNLIISPTVSTDRLTGIDDNFLRIIPPASMHGSYLADTVISRNEKSIVLVLDQRNIEYTGAFVNGIKDRLVSSSSKIVGEILFKDKIEFMDIVKKIQLLSPDAIIFAASGIDTAGIVQQYAKNYPVPQLYGSMWTKITKVNEYGGKTVEGMILIDSYSNRIPTENENNFNQKFKELYSKEASLAARYTYESIYLFTSAAKEAISLKSEDIKTEILKMKLIHGIADNYQLDQYGDVDRKQSLFIIKNNLYVIQDEKK